MDYRPTLNLTQTAFPMKADLVRREPEQLRQWEEQGLYRRIREERKSAPRFVLHDGPPFANGDIHMGTMLNKVLKDFIVKWKTLQGFDAPFVPGWDCHGMPIEQRVVQEEGRSGGANLSKLEIREKCKAYALRYVERQKQQFKRLGVFGDWEKPYLTLSVEYESKIVESLLRFLEEGYLKRGERPIHWCAVCRTALAEAEVEYFEVESSAITVAFPVWAAAPKGLFPFPEVEEGIFFQRAAVLIWTTTPWTLPANLAVAVHPDLKYVLVEENGGWFLLAEDLLAATAAEAGWKAPKVLARTLGKNLEGLRLRHPFLDREVPVVLGGHVTAQAGTGCVHTAPGHGREDYEVGKAYGLVVYSPVDEAGRFTAEVPEYEGRLIWETNDAIVERLETLGRLLARTRLRHSYPHCWRCKQPIFFRATPQWFFDLDHENLRGRMLEQIDRVHWIPEWGKERIRKMVESRVDWCLSRQRSWGVPLPLFYCTACQTPLKDAEVLEAVRERVSREGVEGWFVWPLEDFVRPETLCASCGAKTFKKETDIVDVWVESGVSHAAVLETRQELAFPADLYLEGSDQHRGWFQSSLWTSVALRGTAPYRSVLTHGWVLDEQGRAMHKSLGNVIDPMAEAEKRGADVLRLWVCAQDYREDVAIGEHLLERTAEAYRRIRNTFRFLLGNLWDFDPTENKVEDAMLLPLDRWALLEARRLQKRLEDFYDRYEFTRVFHELEDWCSVQLSARYFDVLKERLYTYAAASRERRSAQTVLAFILRLLVRQVAPVLSFTAEEVWKNLPRGFEEKNSVFLSDPLVVKGLSEEEEKERENWRTLFALRDDVNTVLEKMRREKAIGSSLQAEVILTATSAFFAKLLKKHENDLAPLFLVCRVEVQEKSQIPAEAFASQKCPGVFISAFKTSRVKCARCWNYFPEVGEVEGFTDLCRRCAELVRNFQGAVS